MDTVCNCDNSLSSKVYSLRGEFKCHRLSEVVQHAGTLEHVPMCSFVVHILI